MTVYQSLLEQATQLPVSERVQLIEALWDTVPPDALLPLTDDRIAEIQRRSADFDAGRAQTIPWEQIRAEAFQRAGMNDTR